MISPAYRPGGPDVRPHSQPPRHRLPNRSSKRRLVICAQLLTALVAVVIVVITGMAWAGNRNLFRGITVSQALEGVPSSTGGDQNILIMGLDSRLDQHGRPLPQEMYEALHAGDETAGGYNANVLIVVHIPGGAGPITAISIPRDDYVALSGCPTSDCEGKIKQAYGFAYQHVMDSAPNTDASSSDPTAYEQKAREAGRKAEIKTVRNLLGIPIDHFIEVTLAAFFQIAQVVQPITVCLNEASYDSFSGADFHKGVQQIDAAQAMAFVRQRRDVNDDLFTDLDRTRRQQAFIVSLLSAMRHGGSLSSPSDLHRLLDVARQNIAVDSGFDMAEFVQHASGFTDRGVSLYTLPITGFDQDSAGEDVNTVDVSTIRSIVHTLTAADPSAATPTSEAQTPSSDANTAMSGAISAASGIVLNVVNASQFQGLGKHIVTTFSERGFTAGEVTTAESLTDESTVKYGPGAQAAGEALAHQLNLTATPSDTVGSDTVQLTLGTDFPSTDYLANTPARTSSTSTATTPATPIATVSATATGTQAPAPTELTRMTNDQAPCVK
jgi:LCP family protein required for cell wall assembly